MLVFVFITSAFSQSKCASSAVQLKPAGQASDYGILRSSDNGATWTKVVNDSGAIQSMAEVSSGRVFAGTSGALQGPQIHLGLLRSEDEGSGWTRSSACPDGTDLSDVRSILSLTDGHLLAGSGRGVFRSDDHGETWTRMNRGLPEGAGSNVQSLTANGQGIFFAATYDGIVRWEKNGVWVPAGLKGVPVNVVLVSPKGTLLAGSGGKGMYRSTNEGATWKPVSLVPGRVWVSAMAADSQGHLYAGIADHGLYRSDDDGISWKRLQIPGSKLQVYALATSGRGGVFAAIGNCCPVQSVNLIRSPDSGSTWTRILELHDADVAIGAVMITRKGTLLIGLNSVGE
jgi:photosystem II stability/assembly factor-like uncharacterized protein